jgi:glucose/arabinose dehydrogenase
MRRRTWIGVVALAVAAGCGPSGSGGAPAAPPSGDPATPGDPTTPTPPQPPAAGGGPLALVDVVTGLGPVTDLAFLPDGRMVILEKTGAVKLRAADGAVSVAATYAVDAESEKGLLGVAVDPAFDRTARLFLYFSAADAAGGSDLDRHRVVSVPLAADGTLDRAREVVLLSGLRGPANHDGGALAIGPDGMLYVGVGDTGCNSGEPPGGTITNYFATCLSNANGKILRIGLDGAIPADNPLAQVPSVPSCGDSCGEAPAGAAAPRREIWAWGFRNPWRFWFDPVTGALWVGDVGEVTYEEVTIARAGRHHGWPLREGGAGQPVSRCGELTPGGECVEPAYFCGRSAGAGVDGDCNSITGGLVVDSPSWPEAERGRYVFADNGNGRIWSVAVTAARDGVVAGSRRELARVAGGSPVSLRPGPDGDVYVAVLPGRVVRLGPAR